MQQGVCVVQRELLEQLREITEEESRILNGEAEVDRDLYTSGSDFTIDSNKMLEEGKLIAIRTHTRFVHFPLHRHNYVEYLHFKVSEVLQIQNLLENIIYSLVTGRGNQNKINQTTMGLIFLYLMDSVQYVEMRLPNQYENMISMTTLDYIEQKYRTATLTELCDMLHLPMHVLSKMIKKTTGFNFKELLQRKRLSKAVELMCDTDLPISDIIAAVGYENNSYFHRVFKERYGVTPRAFRVANKKNDKVRL